MSSPIAIEKGARIRLLKCGTEEPDLQPGIEGTVDFIDDIGTIHVAWDNGSTLGLIPGEDEFEIVP